ncbi:Zn-dependent protease with chaperone function [Actinokineospora baliensis]|uniref:M48 family metalloprotease n=1 Tax=Actinokineospora baliensis TaxID=547056 RepID=UPI0019562827|nr:M48 family metalloprotease [Actinokineospora baliensis]MBM7773890.1 Zn-dependent protease with chaperone function [Actinokineospora baliensis]
MTATSRAGLWWVYLLVFLALAINGAGAAQALFMTNDLGDTWTVQACYTAHGISMAEPLNVNPIRDGPASEACSRDYNFALGTTMVIGAAALPAAAWLLMVLGGLVIRWRLRPGPAIARLEAGFDELCSSQGLTGRRRPRLVLAARASGHRQAFTTGVPGARLWVVVPEAYAHVDPREFDVVVSHELGHVHAKDVLWASAVWWTGWISLPALLISLTALAGDLDVVWDFYGEHLVVALVTAIAVLALRAALLRRRELAADQYAGEVLGDPVSAREVLVGAPRKWSPFAVHPSAAERSAPDGRRWEGGFVVSAVAGVVAMLCYQVCYILISAFAGATSDVLVSLDLPMILACLLWSVVLLPAWTRRARSGTTQWFGPLAGAVVGLVGGYQIQVPGAAASMRLMLEQSAPELVGLILLVTLTSAVLARAAAIRLAQTTTIAARVGATLGIAVVLSSGIAAVPAVLASAMLFDTAALVRRSVIGAGSGLDWTVAVLVLLACLALLWRRAGGIWIALAGALTGGAAAAFSWLSRVEPEQTEGADYVLAYQSWWICALAGWVVVLAILLTHRGEPWLSALLLGLTAAVVAGVLWFAIVRLTGSGHGWSALTGSLNYPSWLLLVTVFATTPVLLVAARQSFTPSPLLWSATTVVVTASLAALMITGPLSTLTVAPGDGDESAGAAYEPPPAPMANPNAYRRLSDTDIMKAVSVAAATFPAGTREVPTPPPGDTEVVTPASCQDTVDRAAAAEKAAPRTAEQSRTFVVPVEGVANGVVVEITLLSYRTEPHVLATVDESLRACAHFTTPNPTADDGVTRARLMPRTALPSPYPTRHVAGFAHSTRGPQRDYAVVQQLVTAAGNNILQIDVAWTYRATPPPAATVATIDQITIGAMAGLIAGL